jgi:spermidine/putrescine transport system ATP-binding protein
LADIAAVEARGVTKIFGAGQEGVRALDDVSVTIRQNEFFTLLGPSGCGKTTLLRLIAGFEQPTAGEILLKGSPVEHLPPYQRAVNTVFQSYALFPHMTVAQNISFGLEMRGAAKEKVGSVVEEMLALVKMTGLGGRRPSQLSGGQQQRVALARALANHPEVLLLDEPLSALDLKLRQEMRSELKNLQRRTGITFVFVTHDQEEALTMSDRIAVMSKGKIQQLGAPLDIYERPVNRFVADFIGDTNFVEAQVAKGEGDLVHCRVEGGLDFLANPTGNHVQGAKVTLAIRPERRSCLKSGAASAPSPRRSMSAPIPITRCGSPTACALNVRVQNASGRARPLRGRGQGRHRCAGRRCPHAGGLSRAMSISAAPAELLPASERVARAQATERRRWLRTRWGLSAPAVIIIALFGVLPLLIMVVYSFLEAGEYGGVVWNFSTDAYVSFLFQRDIFDGTLAFSSDYLMIYLRSILFAIATTAICLVLGFPTAYFMATRPPARRQFWVFLVTIPFWSNLLVRTLAVMLIIRDEGLINDFLIWLGVIDKPIVLLYTNFATMLGLLYSFLPFMVLPLYATWRRWTSAWWRPASISTPPAAGCCAGSSFRSPSPASSPAAFWSSSRRSAPMSRLSSWAAASI